MRNKLKLLGLFCLSGALFATLSACSSTGEETGSQSAANQSSTPSQVEEADSDVLRVGMDLKFPPFSYLDDEGNPAGLEPAISYAFGEYLGVPVEIVNTDFSMLIPALETGDVDILIADMAATEARAEKVDFSDPYRYTYTLGLVNKDFATEHNVTDEMSEDEFFALEGAKFIGLSGTKGVYYPQAAGVEVVEVTEIGTGLTEVSMGMSDILIASNEVHGFHAADPDNTVVYSGILAQDGSNFATRKGDSELMEKANEFIASMYEEDGFYQELAEEFDPIIAEFFQNDALGLDYIVIPAE